jgi:hypothetical protein
MRTHLIAIAALVGAGALSLNAQSGQPPQTQQQQQRPADARGGDTTQRAGQNAGDQAITVTGCLKAEKDVAGRRPNMAERAGIGDDFILTNVKMSQASTTSGMGLAAMYEIEGLGESELQKHVNHQVEIVGRLSMGNQMGNRGAAAGGANRGTGTGATGTTGSGTTASGTTGSGTTGSGTTASGTTGTTGTTGSGTTGAGTTGSTARQGGTQGGNQAGANADLPEIQATSIRMVAATCPAQ